MSKELVPLEEIPTAEAMTIVKWSDETGIPAPKIVGLVVRLFLSATIQARSDPANILVEAAMKGGLEP